MNLKWSGRPNSLFGKILISFLTIILLFASFNVLAFAYFKSNIQGEIIQYNQLILKSAAERYSTHFTRIKTLLFNYYYDENVVGFNNQLLTKPEQEVDYYKPKKIILNMRTDIYNPLFYLDNLVVYFHSNDFTIDKDGSSSAWQLFEKSYMSSYYSLQFWNEQFVRPQNFVLLPAAGFRIGTDAELHKELLPFSFKLPSSNYQVIGLIDVRKMQQAFVGEDEGRAFLILNADGKLLYRSTENVSEEMIPYFKADHGYVEQGGNYYFAERDPEGLTYITVVSNASMTSKLKKLNYTLLFIFLLSLAIGTAASLFFSRRINNPVKQLISSIVNRSPLSSSSIHEFAFIHQKIDELRKEKEDIQTDLQSKKSVLTSYSYINKLKSITTEISDWKDFINTDESFTVVLYDLRFRQASFADVKMGTDRAANYIREHIHLSTSDRFPGSHTFQMETNQILSVIAGEVPREQLHQLLQDMKTILDRDKQYCLITVAVSSEFEHTSQFNHAYKQVMEMVQQAMLVEETQLLFHSRAMNGSFTFSPTQDQELNAALQAGNEAGCLQQIERWLDEMEKKEASVAQFHLFAEVVSSKAMKMLEIFKVEPGATWPLKPVIRQLKECCTLDEYKDSFRQLIALATAAIRDKKEQTDPIITYVMDVLLTKYDEDLSLEYLADKRNMSSAYLSVYIKEKTGANFSDHLNHIRIQKAKELLARSDISIQDVSGRIGYRNITSFNRMFKKWVGMTPGEYRKSAME